MNEGIGENHAIIIKGFSHTVGGGGGYMLQWGNNEGSEY